MSKETKHLEETKALMGSLVRMKPKPHEDMKVGKNKAPQTKKKVVQRKAAKTST